MNENEFTIQFRGQDIRVEVEGSGHGQYVVYLDGKALSLYKNESDEWIASGDNTDLATELGQLIGDHYLRSQQ